MIINISNYVQTREYGSMPFAVKPAPRVVGKFHELTEEELAAVRKYESSDEFQEWFWNKKTKHYDVLAYYNQTRLK